jgi:enoyl-CoA hydratase/carnithine racemase
VGDKRAREMLFTNRRIPAPLALDWGLVNRVAPTVVRNGVFVESPADEEIEKAQKGKDGYAIDLSRLDAEVDSLAKELLTSFPECVRYTKQQTNFWKDLAWGLTVRHAQDWLTLHYTDYEPFAGMTAFAKKRGVDFAEVRERAVTPGGSPETPWGAHVASCGTCGAEGLPASLPRCGMCGAAIGAPVPEAVG